MSTADRELIELAERLIEKTVAGDLAWHPTDEDSVTSFDAVLPSGAVRIRSVDNDEQPPYRLSVFPLRGQRAVDGIETVPVALGIPSPENETLSRLYQAARKQALGVDVLLGSLMKDLESEGPVSQSADDDIPF